MKKMYIVFAGLLVCFCSFTALAQDIYLKVVRDNSSTGVLTQGASPNAPTNELKDYARITSMQFGMGNNAMIGGTGPGAGRTQLSELTITKNVDLSSTKLMQALAAVNPLNSVEIVYVANAGRDPVTIYKVELGNAILKENTVSSIPDCSNGCPNVAETFTLIYAKIRVTTYSQNQNGSFTANPNPFVWDQTQNRASF
jgi:type VI secretion system secreted protein Hcp